MPAGKSNLELEGCVSSPEDEGET